MHQKATLLHFIFFEQYNSPRCWITVDMAEEEHYRLPNESRRLEAVKEQILIRYLGLGWTAAHHPWLSNGQQFKSCESFKHLVEVVI